MVVVSGFKHIHTPDTNFSRTTLQFLKTDTDPDENQWNNITKLVNKPQQDSLDSTKFYGYCEDISDNPGYTIGIFGATTDGANDTTPNGPVLFKEYDAVSESSSSSIQSGFARLKIDGVIQDSIFKNEGQSK
jgi:chitosanase